MEKESLTAGCKISKEKEPGPAKYKLNNSKIKEPAQAMTVEGMLDDSKENKLSFLERNEDILRKRMPCVSNQTEPGPVGYGQDHLISERVSGLHDRYKSQNHGSLVLYPGLTGICNTSDITGKNFGKKIDGKISIEVLDLSSVVLKHQFSV